MLSARARSRLAACPPGVVGLTLLLVAQTVWSAERNDPAQELVNEALRQEIYGNNEDRATLLKIALEKSPRSESVHWNLGYVRVNSRWMTVEEATTHHQQDLRRVRYAKARDDYPDTAEGQYALANWCQKQNLPDEERSHLTRVLVHNSEHADARRRLGFRMVDGVWISAQEVAASRQRVAETATAIQTWRGRIEGIHRGLVASSQARQQAAVKRLQAIDDTAVIPVLELMLSRINEDCATLTIDKIADFDGLASTQALARLAVFSPFELARFRAAQKLRDRGQDEYVPAMLSAMYTPVQAQTELYRAPRGRLMYRHIFVREGQNDRQIAVLDSEYRRGAGDAAVIDGLALSHVAATAQQRAATANRQNEMTASLNSRIAVALSTATGESNHEPTEWWTWWNEINEVFVENKGTRTFYGRERYTVDDPTQGSTGGGESGGGTSVTPPGRYDCLKRGSLVWTALGPVAIEQIKIGDRVLSQDPKSGELTYKPVLRTTVRAAEQLVKIKLKDGYVECSGGHLFWSPGKGWVRARKLKSGDRLHGPTSMTRVTCVEEGSFEPTFNLIVADFHTYLVGHEKVLCHDNTIRLATDAIVPGLSPE